MRPILLISILLLTLKPVMAKTYVCIDDNGNKIYTDKASSKTCSVSQLEKLNTYSTNFSSLKKNNTNTIAKPKNIKKISHQSKNNYTTTVSKQIQIKRDSTRRTILSNELKNELQALAEIRAKIRQLRSPAHNGSSIRRLQQQVNEHQQNINVISKELSRI